jgi:hypothetical protein
MGRAAQVAAYGAADASVTLLGCWVGRSTQARTHQLSTIHAESWAGSMHSSASSLTHQPFHGHECCGADPYALHLLNRRILPDRGTPYYPISAPVRPRSWAQPAVAVVIRLFLKVPGAASTGASSTADDNSSYTSGSNRCVLPPPLTLVSLASLERGRRMPAAQMAARAACSHPRTVAWARFGVGCMWCARVSLATRHAHRRLCRRR